MLDVVIDIRHSVLQRLKAADRAAELLALLQIILRHLAQGQQRAKRVRGKSNGSHIAQPFGQARYDSANRAIGKLDRGQLKVRRAAPVDEALAAFRLARRPAT